MTRDEPTITDLGKTNRYLLELAATVPLDEAIGRIRRHAGATVRSELDALARYARGGRRAHAERIAGGRACSGGRNARRAPGRDRLLRLVARVILAGELKPSIQDFDKERGRFPADNEAAGVPAAEHLIGQYVTDIEVADGAMHIRFGNKVNTLLAGRILTVRPVFVTANPGSPIAWNCGPSAPPNGMTAAGADRTDMLGAHLPAGCRP